jgi:hypothetical protein
MLEKATRRSGDRYTTMDILLDILEDKETLWIAFEGQKILGALTTGIVPYPHRLMLVGQFLGGERIMDWRKPMLETLDKFAKDQGCTGFEMAGREGFLKVLGPFGWRKKYTVFEKDYRDG